jgi:prepilin-type N-terminal cleavage/methylation domain-containing protein
MRRSATTDRRAGFTLVELLVVLGIIALLAGLLLSAVAKFRVVGPRVQTRAEIGELHLAVESFKSTYQVPYMPTALIISNNYSNLASPGVQDSRAYISKVWAKSLFTGPPPGNLPGQTNWSQGEFRMDGNQVMLLLLGGMPPTYQGWMNSPNNPFQVPPDGSVAKGPFFNFKADRIRQNPNAMPHYLDPYGNPYYYFSSRNGGDYEYFGKFYYNLAPDNSPNPDAAGRVFGITREGGFGDPASFTQVAPLRGIDGKYLNPNGFQILSMGENGRPGRGSFCNNWEPNNVPWPNRFCRNPNGSPAWTLYEPGIGDYAPAGPGGDDISNFAQGLLGGN